MNQRHRTMKPLSYLPWLVMCLVCPAGPAQAAPASAAAGHADLEDCPDEPGCPAIILLDERELNNESGRTRYTAHRVIKFFTERGIDEYGQVDTSAVVGGYEVRNMEGRTIRPDGSEIKLKADDIHVKYLKRGKRREKVKSATFPGIVPGAIVDYSYDIVTPPNSYIVDMVWDLQQPLPIRESRFVLKPGKYELGWTQAGKEPVVVDHTTPFKGVNHLVARNVPSIPDEPYGPSAGALQSQVFFGIPTIQRIWLGVFAGRWARRTGIFTDDNDDVRKKVGEIVAEGDSPTVKVRKIYDFVQREIGAPESDEDPEGGGRPESVDEVLARGHGSEFERSLLFEAMARAAGLETGMLLLVSRGSGTLDPKVANESQFDSYAVAVKTGAGWTFYDPAVRHCPFGMISAEKEGGEGSGILLHPDKNAGAVRKVVVQNLNMETVDTAPYAIIGIPFSKAARNVLKREARVTLDPDGTGHVEVSLEGTGQVELGHRRTFGPLTEEERVTTLTGEIERMIPAARLVSSDFENIDAFGREARIKYVIEIPGLAAVVADKLIISPSFLEATGRNPFTAERRRTAVEFPYAKRTQDRIMIEIPEGYAIPETPGPIVERDGPFVLTVSFAQTAGKLIMTRRLEIDAVVWPAEDYPRLKAFFEKLQQADRFAVTIQREGDA